MADEFVIDDSTKMEDILAPGKGTGLELPQGFGGPSDYAGVAEPFPYDLMLSDSAIQALIEEREAQKSRHRDVARQYGLKSKDQGRTNYCWINSPAYCLEYLRILQNEGHVPLSPASGGGPIKNFSNQGGWGRQALEWISERGLVPTEFWPDNAIESRYYTDANRARALSYRCSEWWVFPSRDLRAVASCVVGLGIPVSGGFNWWGHQVTYVDFVWKNNTFVPVIRNSWGDQWQDEGYALLEGTRALADDAVAPAVALSS